jgi:cell division protein FtsL
MARVNLFFLALVVACAIGVITAQHHSRKLFVELENGQVAAQKLAEEWTQLQLEQSTWATNKRVEALASRSLGMRLPEPSSTVIVTAAARAAQEAR